MRLSKRGFALSVAAVLWGFALFSQQPPAAPNPVQMAVTSEVFRTNSDDLKNHPFPIGGLLLSIGHGNEFSLRLENASTEFQTFDPGDLAVVDATGRQDQLWSQTWLAGKFIFSPTSPPIRLAPGAFTTREFVTRYKLKFPFKVYCKERLFAEVSK